MMKSTASSKVRDDIADPGLYRLYWSLILSDICHMTGIDATKANKDALHEFHKKELGWDTISNRSHEALSRFLLEVVAWWAVEKGIFVRTNRHQPVDIQHRSFFDVVTLDDGRKVRILDIL